MMMTFDGGGGWLVVPVPLREAPVQSCRAPSTLAEGSTYTRARPLMGGHLKGSVGPKEGW